jgi:uncharacterized protein YegJ (DUF2314 family)
MAARKKRTKRSAPRAKHNPIKVGDFVKARFVQQPPIPGDPASELMWVQVTRVRGSSITGRLDNKPAFFRSIRYGDSITFPRSAVIGYLQKP